MSRCAVSTSPPVHQISVPPSVGANLAHWGNLHMLSEGVPLSRPASHIPVITDVTVRIERDMFIPGSGREVARSQFCPHKCPGAPYCVDAVTEFCSSAVGSACSDSHKQQLQQLT
ncbi:hypothetical protein ATANTOWER_026950 [Ataeniobius toweri]|uniref:Uncharacterized protein n=1 Tax=Ataeniobius toweri TaxID=208326 RepID=A0ABU7BUX1_9TELE|nr:hypothetical protein [Ataeniobius toweri]